MLLAPVWNLPAGYRTGQFFRGGLDRTCVAATDPGRVRWCAWMRWNMPGPADCMSRALYDSLASAVYCPAGSPSRAPAGHLELDIVRRVDLRSPGTHLTIPGEISARGLLKSAADLVFDGCPLQQFMTSAFDRSASAGCSARVVNPHS